MNKLAGGLGLVAGAMMLMSGNAFALDSSWDALSKAGKHQFYVWCTGRDDYEESAEGSDAKDAQAKVAASAGDTCWPVWQGLQN